MRGCCNVCGGYNCMEHHSIPMRIEITPKGFNLAGPIFYMPVTPMSWYQAGEHIYTGDYVRADWFGGIRRAALGCGATHAAFQGGEVGELILCEELPK